MRLTTRWAAALLLASAAAAVTGGGARAQSASDAPAADIDVSTDVSTEDQNAGADVKANPGRVPEINVTVTPPKVDVQVDSPFVSVRPGAVSIRPEGLAELKRKLGDGRWKGAIDVIEGRLRARLARDPSGRFHVLAQSAPPGAPPPSQPDSNPRGGDVLGDADSADEQQQRMLEIYRAQLGERMRMQKAAFLGVSTSPVPAPLRKHLGLQEGVGLVVEMVEDDSPAQKAGLKQYDILKKLDDQLLVNGQQLAVLIRTHKAGDTVKLSITRGGKEQSVEAKLVEKDVKPLEALDMWEGGGQPPRGQLGMASPDAALREWSVRAGPDGKGFVFSGPNRLGDKAAKDKAKANGKVRGDKTMMVYKDDEYEMTITSRPDDAGGRHLVAKNRKSGKVVYDGPIDDKERRAELPPALDERLKRMDKGWKSKKDSGDTEKEEERIIEEKLSRHRDKKDDGEHDAGNDNDNDNDRDEDHDARGENRAEDRDEHDDDDRGDDERPERAAVINRGDVVELSISGVQAPGVETVKVVRVRDGEVSLPYVGKVKAEGLTENQLQKSIVKVYSDAKVGKVANVQVKRVHAGEWPEHKEHSKP